MEKAEVLNAFFASVLTSKTSIEKSQVPETREEGLSKDDVPVRVCGRRLSAPLKGIWSRTFFNATRENKKRRTP